MEQKLFVYGVKMYTDSVVAALEKPSENENAQFFRLYIFIL